MSPLPEKPSYNFITECFFLCQQALHQGFSVVPKLSKLRRSVRNLHNLYEQIKNVYPKEVVEPVREQTTRGEYCIRSTVNFLNIQTPKQFVVITLKFEQCGSTIQ